MDKYADCIWDHCSDIARCPCCRKDDRIAELEAKNWGWKRRVEQAEAKLAEYEADEPDIEPFKPKTVYTLKGKLKSALGDEDA